MSPRRFISLVEAAPPGFDAHAPSKRDLLEGSVAIWAPALEDATGLLSGFARRVSGVVATPGPELRHARVGPTLWHLTVPPTQERGLMGLAACLIDVMSEGNAAVKANRSIEASSARDIQVLRQVREGYDRSIERLGRTIEILRHEMEERRATEEKYRNLFESSMDAIVLLDMEGQLLECNPAAVEMFAAGTREALLRLKPSALSPELQPDGRWSAERVREEADTIMRRGSNQFLWRYRALDGREFPATVHAVATEVSGRTLVLGTVRDMTEWERAQMQLRQSQKMEAIGQLAGGVAHDFNNLLQVILGYGELSRVFVEPDSELDEHLEQMMQAGEQARGLVRQLLAFSRRQVLEMQPIDLHETVTQLSKMVRRVIGDNIELVVAPRPERGFVRADRGQLEQILLNLCVNARDAMPDGGALTISVQLRAPEEMAAALPRSAAQTPHVVLSVSDTGCGMSEATQAAIFEPFFTTKGIGEGTGLGLSTVYGLVEQHEGHIRVHSQLGVGSTFEVLLPLVDDPPPHRDALQPVETPGGVETILFAEDDESVRALTRSTLEMAGYAVLTAADGVEALDLFERHGDEIDLVLLDVSMPRLDGAGVWERVVETHPHLPVVFASGYSVDSLHTDFVLNEGVELMQKPWSSGELLALVRRRLDAPR